MLIGAHVSTAGGLAKAVSRGEDLGCSSIQIFNQSPRAWKPSAYGDEDFAAFREAMDKSDVQTVIIHAVYLINCATPDPELRAKSLTSLTNALRIGEAIGAIGPQVTGPDDPVAAGADGPSAAPTMTSTPAEPDETVQTDETATEGTE